MGNSNSNLSLLILNEKNEKNEATLHKHYKYHSNNNIPISNKQMQQNENSLNEFNLHSFTLNTDSSTLKEEFLELLQALIKISNSMNHQNSNSSFSSSNLEKSGWDSSTSTLNNNNNILSKTNNMDFMNFQSTSTLVFDENLPSPGTYTNSQYNNSGELIDNNHNNYNPVIGHITDTFIVDEPEEISDVTSNSSLTFPREHDNDSNETATLNPSLLFNSDEFYSLSEANVISLLQRDDIEINEIEVWNHTIMWGIKNTFHLSTKNWSKWNEQDFESLKETLRNCIPWIRFYQIKPQEFADFVWPFRRILSKSIIGNFLREQITGHAPIMETGMTPPRIPSSDIDSIIMTGRHATILASWIQQEHFCGTIPFNFNLIYRASRDGLSSKVFHEKCDDKGPTILVIKLLNSKRIIGAFNPLSYQKSKMTLRRRSLYGNKQKRNSYDFSSDPCLNIKETKKQTFLYSFQTRYYPEETAIISRLIPEFSNESVKHSYNTLSFGSGPDLQVNLNYNEKIGKVFPSSYQNPILNFEGEFEFEELEVFQVLKKEDIIRKDEW